MNNTQNENATYTLTDALGKIISHGSQPLGKGVSVITIDLKNAARGVYLFSVGIGSTRVLKKIVY